MGKNENTGFRKSQKLLTGRSQQSFKGGHIDSLKEAAFLVVGNERILAMSTILPVPVDEGKRGSALFPMKGQQNTTKLDPLECYEAPMHSH